MKKFDSFPKYLFFESNSLDLPENIVSIKFVEKNFPRFKCSKKFFRSSKRDVKVYKLKIALKSSLLLIDKI